VQPPDSLPPLPDSAKPGPGALQHVASDVQEEAVGVFHDLFDALERGDGLQNKKEK